MTKLQITHPDGCQSAFRNYKRREANRGACDIFAPNYDFLSVEGKPTQRLIRGKPVNARFMTLPLVFMAKKFGRACEL